jgi:hypothetical protein
MQLVILLPTGWANTKMHGEQKVKLVYLMYFPWPQIEVGIHFNIFSFFFNVAYDPLISERTYHQK